MSVELGSGPTQGPRSRRRALSRSSSWCHSASADPERSAAAGKAISTFLEAVRPLSTWFWPRPTVPNIEDRQPRSSRAVAQSSALLYHARLKLVGPLTNPLQNFLANARYGAKSVVLMRIGDALSRSDHESGLKGARELVVASSTEGQICSSITAPYGEALAHCAVIEAGRASNQRVSTRARLVWLCSGCDLYGLHLPARDERAERRCIDGSLPYALPGHLCPNTPQSLPSPYKLDHAAAFPTSLREQRPDPARILPAKRIGTCTIAANSLPRRMAMEQFGAARPRIKTCRAQPNCRAGIVELYRLTIAGFALGFAKSRVKRHWCRDLSLRSNVLIASQLRRCISVA